MEGVPAPRPWRCLARSWRGLRARGKGCPARAKGKRLAVVIVPTVWWSCWPRCVWGARPALSSVGKARVGACRSAEVGTLAVGLTPRACPGVAVGAPVDVYLPLPEVSGLLRAGSRPSPRSSLSRGSSRSSTSPPPSFHLSRNGAARVHGGFVLRLRFSPGAGRCPVSPARPPLAWSSLAGFADSWLRPEGQGASRFPDVAPRCCVLGGGPLRPPPAREPLPHPPVCGFAPRSVGPWRCVASGACPPRGG